MTNQWQALWPQESCRGLSLPKIISAFREYCESAQGLPASTEAAGAARHNLVIGNEGPKPLVSHAGPRSDPEHNGTDVTPSFPPAGIRAEPLFEGLRAPRFHHSFGRLAR